MPEFKLSFFFTNIKTQIVSPSEKKKENGIKLNSKIEIAGKSASKVAVISGMFLNLPFQIQQVAGRHLSESQRYRQGPEGFGGDVIGAGAHGQQPVQQRRP